MNNYYKSFFMSAAAFLFSHACANELKNKVIIQVVNQDITTMNVDAIVNAANKYLPWPGIAGVAAAIYNAAGGNQLNAWVEQNIKTQENGIRIPVGQAIITPSFNLEQYGIKHIIHAVGPNIAQGDSYDQLFSAYQNSLKIALENNIKTIAFPAISIGIFGGDKKKCAGKAVQAIRSLSRSRLIKLEAIYFVVQDKEYEKYLSEELKNLENNIFVGKFIDLKT